MSELPDRIWVDEMLAGYPVNKGYGSEASESGLVEYIRADNDDDREPFRKKCPCLWNYDMTRVLTPCLQHREWQEKYHPEVK